MPGLGDFVAKFSADISGFSEQIKRVADNSDNMTASIVKGQLAADAIGKVAQSAFRLASDAIVSVTVGAANYGDAINELTQKTGLSAEQASKWSYAAKQSGMSADDVTGSIAKLSKNMDEASNGNKSAAEGFERLGVSVKKADGTLRPVNDVMGDVAERFSNMDDGAQKAALAQEIFGKSGSKLIPLLNEGRAGLQKMNEEAEKYGLVISSAAAKAGDEFNDSLGRLDGATTGFSNTLGASLLPSVTLVTDAIVDITASMTAWIKQNPEAIDGMMGLAEVMVVNVGTSIRLVLDGFSRFLETIGIVGVAIGADFGDKFKAAAKVADEFSNQINNSVNRLESQFSATQKATAATAKHSDGLRDSAKAIEETTKAQDKLNKQIFDAGPFWEKAEREATAAIEKNFDLALSLSELRMKRNDLLKADERWLEISNLSVDITKNQSIEFGSLFAELKPLTDLFNTNLVIQNEVNKTVEESNRAMGVSADLVAELTGLRREDIIAIREGAAAQDKADKDAAAAAESYQRIWEQATGNVVTGFVDGFSDIIFHAKGFGDTMKSIALSTAESMFKAFMTGMISPLTSAMSGLGKTMAEALSGGGGGAEGIIGAVGGGKAAGGAGIGKALGGFLTNPWTIGIGAGIAGITAIVKSQAHWEANDWVQNHQNPFDRAMAMTSDPDEREKLISSYVNSWDAFESRGGDEAKVIDQARDTLNQRYAVDLQRWADRRRGESDVANSGLANAETNARLEKLIALMQQWMQGQAGATVVMDGQQVGRLIANYLNRLKLDEGLAF